MQKRSDWTGGLLPHEQARLSRDVDGSGMAQHDAAEKTAATVVVAQAPGGNADFDQEADDPRLFGRSIIKQPGHTS